MAPLTRSQSVALALAAVLAVAVPMLALRHTPDDSPTATAHPVDLPLIPPTRAPAVAVERALFTPDPVAERAPADAPKLIGIIGRIGTDAVALVRASDGTTQSLSVGEITDGWRLVSLSADAGYFTRGRRRARVGLAASDAPPVEPSEDDPDAEPSPTDQ